MKFKSTKEEAPKVEETVNERSDECSTLIAIQHNLIILKSAVESLEKIVASLLNGEKHD